MIQRDQEKIGRNDPCRCASGKKYKKCCERADLIGSGRLREPPPPAPPADEVEAKNRIVSPRHRSPALVATMLGAMFAFSPQMNQKK